MLIISLAPTKKHQQTFILLLKVSFNNSVLRSFFDLNNNKLLKEFNEILGHKVFYSAYLFWKKFFNKKLIKTKLSEC